MKTPAALFSFCVILILFSNCASSQFDKNPSFTVETAQYQNLIGGKPGSNGTMITVEFTQKIEKNIQFDSIYFINKSAKLNVNSSEKKTVVSGIFKTSNFKDNMVIIDKNPKKEVGNRVPKQSKQAKFLLSKDACVISYIINDRTYYYKINSLKKGKPIIFP